MLLFDAALLRRATIGGGLRGGGQQLYGTVQPFNLRELHSGLVGVVLGSSGLSLGNRRSSSSLVSVGSVIAGRANSLFPSVVQIIKGRCALHEQTRRRLAIGRMHIVRWWPVQYSRRVSLHGDATMPFQDRRETLTSTCCYRASPQVLILLLRYSACCTE